MRRGVEFARSPQQITLHSAADGRILTIAARSPRNADKRFPSTSRLSVRSKDACLRRASIRCFSLPRYFVFRSIVAVSSRVQHTAKRRCVKARSGPSSSPSIPSLLESAMKASDCGGVIGPLRSAIARTFVILRNHQAGARALGEASRRIFFFQSTAALTHFIEKAVVWLCDCRKRPHFPDLSPIG